MFIIVDAKTKYILRQVSTDQDLDILTLPHTPRSLAECLNMVSYLNGGATSPRRIRAIDGIPLLSSVNHPRVKALKAETKTRKAKTRPLLRNPRGIRPPKPKKTTAKAKQ